MAEEKIKDGRLLLEKLWVIYQEHIIAFIIVIFSLSVAMLLGLRGLVIFVTVIFFVYIYRHIWKYVNDLVNGQGEDYLKPILIWLVYMLTTTVVYISLLFFALILTGIFLLLGFIVK